MRRDYGRRDHGRQAAGTHRWTRRRSLAAGAGVAVWAAAGAGLLAGCSAASAVQDGSGVGATCGSTHTAAGVPVIIKVATGTVDCTAAMQVENEYADKIKAGQVAGNGGGAPVTVNGWTCQGYPTPEVLSTGDASQCHTGTAEILAVLPVPTST